MQRSKVLLVTQYPMRSGALLELLPKALPSPVLTSDVRAIIDAVANEITFELVILHGSLPYCDPILRAFSDVRASRIPPPLIVVATDSSEEFAISALRAGALDYYTEPVNLTAFCTTLSRLSHAHATDTVLAGGEILVGESAAMQVLRQHILRVAATDCNVLITGETGTGKELVAQLVHQNSARRLHSLVCINCAAVPDSLLESELFGYERGSFTGANTTSQGKLMSANKGTVFFDEIGDMSAYAQAKILRLIECKEVQRLGSTRKLSTDVRVLAATHHDLDELGPTQTFRRDLYFRLNVGRIHLLPLRERKGDIPDLVARMVLDLNRKLGRHIQGVTEGAMHRLVAYDWPGNIRELKNVVERIFIDCDSGRITEQDLPILLRSGPQQSRDAREEEVQFLRTTLINCEWNKSKAAEKLNWSRMTLYRKLAKYGFAEKAIKKCPEAAPAQVAPGLDGKLS